MRPRSKSLPAITEKPHKGIRPVAPPMRGAALPESAREGAPTRVRCSKSSMST